MADKKIVAYWLCPAEPARSQLAEIINDLAARFDAPVFEPHVTTYVTDAERENPAAVLDGLIKQDLFYRLVVRGVDYSDKFTKTLFVQFAPDDRVTRLSEELRRASVTQENYELNPHLSLLYKKMHGEMKRQLAPSIRLPFTEIAFDTIKVVISPAEIKSREEVEAWRVIAERRFTE